MEWGSMTEPKLDDSSGGVVACDRKRIVIVDDEDAIVRLFKMILLPELPGVEIETANNGLVAFNVFKEKRPALLLMDLNMPVMDGRIAFMEIQKHCEQNNWEMPAVVFCTGFAPPESIRSVVAKSEVNLILAKPVRCDVLIQAVKSRLKMMGA
jgi:CheY-like chemotaxis protein